MIINFYNRDVLESTITANYKDKTVSVVNHTADKIHLAFGVNENPTWEDFEDFLESRCPSRDRANIKEILEDLGVDSYNPIEICEATEGRTAEDLSWMEFDWEIE